MARRSIAGLAFAVAFAVGGCSGSPSAASPAEAPSPTPPSPSVSRAPEQVNQFVDIGGGRKLHLFCFGDAPAGLPTVVGESGLGGGSDVWPPDILHAVAATTRFCSYDRAGLGGSDPASEPVRTSQDMADDLDALLTASEIDGPYVFLTHSMGIWNVLLYAKAHPDNVLGVVVADPRGAEVSAQWLAALPVEADGEAEGIALMRGDLTDFEGDATANDDHLDLITASQEVGAAMDPADLLFGDKPVVVLSAANTPDGWSDLPDALLPEFDRIWFDAQKSIAAESSNGTFVTVEGSGHEIQWDQPEAVVSQILKVIGETSG